MYMHACMHKVYERLYSINYLEIMQMFRKSTGPGVKRHSRFQSCSFMYILLLLSRFSHVQLCADPIDGSPPGFPTPGILQARTLEWVAISFSNAWKWKVKVKMLNCVRLLATPWTEAYQAPPSVGFSRQEYWSGVPWHLWLLGITHQGNQNWKRHVYPNVHCSTVYNSQDMEAT